MKKDVKQLNCFQTQMVIAMESMHQLHLEVLHLWITLTKKNRKLTKNKREMDLIEKKNARFNKSKVAAIAALNKKSLMKSQIMLEHCQVELQLKDKEHKNYIKAIEHQSVIQNHYKAANQLVKDASIARKAH